MTTTALEQDWDKVIIHLNKVYRPTKTNDWTITLNSECQRQYSLPLKNFTKFEIYNYQLLSECREALRKLYYSNQYEETQPPKQYTFVNEKTGDRITLTENQIESKAKKLLDLALSSVHKLIANSNKIMKNWKFNN